MDEGEEKRGGWLLHTPPPRWAPSSFPQVPWLTVLVWQRGREHLAGCSPWWPAGFRCIFPGSPDEWSLIAVGEGFASAAQCTRLTPLGRPCEEGLKQCWLPVTQPYSQRKCTAADSLTAGECVYKGTEGVRSHSVSGGMWDSLWLPSHSSRLRCWYRAINMVTFTCSSLCEMNLMLLSANLRFDKLTCVRVELWCMIYV